MEGFEIKLARQITKAWSAMTFFSADDFRELLIPPYDEKAANIASQKLRRDAKVVYICEDPRKLTTIHFPRPVDATHTGLLICVEEIERKPCIHVGSLCRNTGDYYFECTKCGAKLKPTAWEVVE